MSALSNRVMAYYEKRGFRRLLEPDMLIALSAILVSFCALGVSVVQVQLMRQEQRANAWPRVEAYVNTGSAFLMKLTNKGFGPAMIKAVVVTVDSVPIADWRGVMAALVPNDSIELTQSKITDVVISPQSEVQMIAVARGVQSDSVSGQVERVGMRVCFCSIYDDCWWLLRPSFGGGTRWTFEEVKDCVVEENRRFRM